MDVKGVSLKKVLPHTLTNFKIQRHYQNESRFNGVHSRDNIPNKINDGEYVINLDEYPDIGTHWIGLYVFSKNIAYLDSFELNIFQKKS